MAKRKSVGSIETSATARLIVQRLRMLEDYVRGLEAADGHSIHDWQRWAREARKSPRRSALRRAFRERCRTAKKRSTPIRELVTRNAAIIRLMEDPVLRMGGAVFHDSPQGHSGHSLRCADHTVLTAVRKCWILGSECVEPAREGILVLLDKQRQLASLRELMNAIGESQPSTSQNPKLFNADGTLKEGAFKILKALGKPRVKLSGIRAAAGFETEQAVKDFSGVMRAEGWIERRPDRSWIRTPLGMDVLRAAEK